MINPFRIIVNFFFPSQCVFCDGILEPNTKENICHKCNQKLIVRNSGLKCSKCGKPIASYGKRKICYFCYDRKTKYFDRIVSSFEYSGLVKASILRYKSKNIPAYAPTYAKFLSETVTEHYGNISFDFICSAPSHTDKTREQGFDNVGLICKHLSKQLNIPFHSDALKKIRQTPRQTGLDFHKREENLKDSMEAVSSEVCEKTILLVDDVCTTRATVIECSRALKQAGAKKVYAVTLATTARKIKRNDNIFYIKNEEVIPPMLLS